MKITQTHILTTSLQSIISSYRMRICICRDIYINERKETTKEHFTLKSREKKKREK
jgi:hypothetical protein